VISVTPDASILEALRLMLDNRISGLPVVDNNGNLAGTDGKGNQELGAPNLTDQIWLFGSDEADIIETIANGPSGVMPAWTGRLDPATINALAVYVHTLGGGK
jgi:cytochrome c oxidase cbb3-type subunit III